MTSSELSDASVLPIRASLQLAWAASVAIAILITGAVFVGLLHPAIIYPTDELLRSRLPTDLVNFLGMPALLGAMWLERRGNLVGLLLWPGALLYLLYHDCVYVLGMPFSAVFLVHGALFVLSLSALISLLRNIDGPALQQLLTGAVGERAGGGALALLGVAFFVSSADVMGHSLVRGIPVAAPELGLRFTDLLMSPAWIIGGVLLWRRRALGYVTGIGLLFQGLMLFVGLILLLVLRRAVNGVPFVFNDAFVIFLMSLICLVPLSLFLRGVISRQSGPLTLDAD